MKTTSQLLKGKRESMDISLVEVSIATKITPRTLQAIEAADLDHLPARSFLRGFVKSYAAFLKMDVDEVLKTFSDEMTALETPPPAPMTPPKENVETSTVREPIIRVAKVADENPYPRTADLNPEGVSTTRKLSIAFGLFLLLVCVGVAYRLVAKYEREGQVESPPSALNKIENPETKPAAETKTVEPVQETKPVVETKVDTKPPEEKAPAPTPAPAVVAAPVVAPKPAEVKPAEIKPAEVKAPEVKPTEVKPAETKPAESKKVVQEVIIEALDKVELTFKVNGDTERVTLMPDQVHTIKAAGLIGLELSDGGAVNIIVNGREIGVPGDLGKPKKIQIP